MYTEINSPKVVLYISTGLSTGGAERMLYNLLSKTNRLRFEPIVVSLLDRGTWGDRIEALNIPVYTVGMKRGMPTPPAFLRLMQLISQTEPDLIQGWMYHGNLAAQLATVFRQKRIPVLWSIHNSADALVSEKKMTEAVVKFGAQLSKYPANITFVSRTSKSQHEVLGYSSANACVIPNGFDTSLFTPSIEAKSSVRLELGLSSNCFLIGLICRYHPMKDHANFIQAAALLLKDRSDVHFILAGTEVNSENHSLQQLIQNLEISNHIHLLGERKDISRLTAALDIASSASAYGEAFPMVVGESMSCAVPCVVTDVGDSAWIVGNTGKVVPPRNSEALANAWKELIEMGEEYRQALGKAARARIIECFGLETVVSQYEAVYENALLNNKSEK